MLTQNANRIRSQQADGTTAENVQSAVTFRIKEVFGGGDARAQLLTLFINFGIVPFAAYGVGVYFQQDIGPKSTPYP